jgi:acyl-CoA thioesterase-2
VERASPELRAQVQQRWPVELIPIEPSSDEPERGRRMWLRARGELPGDPNLHRCVLAFASDMGALRVCMQAMGADFGDPNLEVASLDHALWFHRDFRADQWLLFDQQAVRVSGGRGLSRGCVFDRDGRLIASLAQEGVMRRR